MSRLDGPRAWVTVFLKGACMGAADTVPGVSGGTIAVIVGVYERLITALTSLDPRVAGRLRRAHTSEGRAALARELVRMDVPFLLALGAGVVTAAATLATLMNVAIRTYRAPTYAFFFGLIAASAVVLYRYVDAGTPGRVLVGIVGFSLAFLLTDPTLIGEIPATLPVLFLAGAVAISAMVLPGISGSFLLLMLGQYEFVSGIPRRIFRAVFEAIEGNATALLDATAPLASFLAGALVGVFSVAYAVRAALDRYREGTLVFLVSLMVGALRLPVTEVVQSTETLSAESVALVGIPAVGGALLVLLLDRYTDDLQY
jgi:putative membrane protein